MLKHHVLQLLYVSAQVAESNFILCVHCYHRCASESVRLSLLPLRVSLLTFSYSPTFYFVVRFRGRKGTLGSYLTT